MLRVLVEIALGSGIILTFEDGFHSDWAVFFQDSTKLFEVPGLCVNFCGQLLLSDDSVDELLSKF